MNSLVYTSKTFSFVVLRQNLSPSRPSFPQISYRPNLLPIQWTSYELPITHSICARPFNRFPRSTTAIPWPTHTTELFSGLAWRYGRGHATSSLRSVQIIVTAYSSPEKAGRASWDPCSVCVEICHRHYHVTMTYSLCLQRPREPGPVLSSCCQRQTVNVFQENGHAEACNASFHSADTANCFCLKFLDCCDLFFRSS